MSVHGRLPGPFKEIKEKQARQSRLPLPAWGDHFVCSLMDDGLAGWAGRLRDEESLPVGKLQKR